MATPLAEEGATWSRLLEPEPSAGSLCAREGGKRRRRETQNAGGVGRVQVTHREACHPHQQCSNTRVALRAGVVRPPPTARRSTCPPLPQRGGVARGSRGESQRRSSAKAAARVASVGHCGHLSGSPASKGSSACSAGRRIHVRWRWRLPCVDAPCACTCRHARTTLDVGFRPPLPPPLVELTREFQAGA